MTTRALLELSDWMTTRGVTHVVMEATGSYWKAVWHALEGSFELILANAAEVKNMPGRKSDINDAEWVSDLLAHGLIRSSFVPPAPIQDLRELTRTRKQLVREVVQHTQRIQKTLDTANLKVSGVVSDILGATGRAIVKALIGGETDPERLADLAKGTLRHKRSRLVEALHGRVRPHHRNLLKVHLDLVESLEQAIAELDRRIGEAIEPFRDVVKRLKTIPGVSDLAAQTIVAEVGTDMSRFPTAQHLVSWARLCPRLDRSAGKDKSTRTLKGMNWLKTLLVQVAWVAIRSENSYARAQFLRLRTRRGPKKAIIAVAASILTAIYYMLRNGTDYHDLTGGHFDRLDREKQTQRLVRGLRRLGYDVRLERAA
jgi:transposase